MAEENQQEPQQVTQRVTTKDPKKVEAGRHLAAHNHKKRELKVQKSEEQSELNQYCRIGAVIAVGMIGGLGYYIYRTKKGGPQSLGATSPAEMYQIILLSNCHALSLTSLRWIKSLLFYKNGQEEYSK